MKKRLYVAAAIAAVGLGALFGSPAGADPEPVTEVASCENSNVDCGEFPSPEEIPAGTPCAIKIDGEWLEGETNEQGQCVCTYTPPTTVPSTTVPEETTTTVAPTTSTTVAPTTSTVPETTTSTVAETPTTAPSTTAPIPSDDNLFETCQNAIDAGHAPLYPGDVGYRPELDADGDGVACETDNTTPSFVVQPAASGGELPRTGSNSNVILGFTGFGLLCLGLALVKVRGLIGVR